MTYHRKLWRRSFPTTPHTEWPTEVLLRRMKLLRAEERRSVFSRMWSWDKRDADAIEAEIVTVKAILDTREHVPNKKERKKLRQEKGPWH